MDLFITWKYFSNISYQADQISVRKIPSPADMFADTLETMYNLRGQDNVKTRVGILFPHLMFPRYAYKNCVRTKCAQNVSATAQNAILRTL